MSINENLNITSLSKLLEKLIFEFGPNLLIATILLFGGLWIINRLINIIQIRLTKKHFDESLQKFLLSLLAWTLKIMLFISVLGQLGIESTSFVAVLGAAGLAVGLALQGSLSNLAGGVLIMVFRPFKVGDFIETQGITGTVKLIDIFTTKLVTVENKLVIIPNGALSNGNITNLSAEGSLKLNISFLVPHDTNLLQLKEEILGILSKQENILKEPLPDVDVKSINDKGIEILVRPTIKTNDQDKVYHQTLSEIALIIPKNFHRHEDD